MTAAGEEQAALLSENSAVPLSMTLMLPATASVPVTHTVLSSDHGMTSGNAPLVSTEPARFYRQSKQFPRGAEQLVSVCRCCCVRWTFALLPFFASNLPRENEQGTRAGYRYQCCCF